MAESTHDVIIAGAGPIGLFLACELALRNISVLVLEREKDVSSPWKSEPFGLRGLNTPSAEHFHRRGLLAGVCDTNAEGQPKQAVTEAEKRSPGPAAGQNPEFKFGGHFAGIFLDAGKMNMKRWPYLLSGPALSPRPTSIERIEKVLGERAAELGVDIRRACGATGVVAQNDESVTVEAGEGKQRFTGSWLVGCDGGRSIVRRAAGFDFEGTEATFTGYISLCEWDSVSIKPGWHYTERGMYTVRPVGEANMLYIVDFDGGAFDRTQETSKNHLQQLLRRISGDSDVIITHIHIASTFTDRCKQASTYRKGRILLAGDAAHIHSPLGAQGLNLGLSDAMNLGWKLAATIKAGSSNLKLLDTYTTERHPMGVWVLEWQRAQVSIIKPDPWGAAQRRLIQKLIDTDDGASLFIDRFWGLSQKYDLGGEQSHPLLGSSVPDFELRDGTRLGQEMAGGQGVMLDFTGNAGLERIAKDESEVQYLNTTAKDQLKLAALLVRPDGIVTWIAEEGKEVDLKAAKAALEAWSI